MNYKNVLCMLLMLCLLFIAAGCKQNSGGNSSVKVISHESRTGSGESSEDLSSDLPGEIESGLTSVSSSSKSSTQIISSKPSNPSQPPVEDISGFSITALQDKYQNMKFTSKSAPAQRTVGSEWIVQDLGTIALSGYPLDDVYDWAPSIIKVGDTYKMWWTRGSPKDTVWYAESKDMKHWTNAQLVIRIDKDTEWIKTMLGWTEVLYVGGKYYMFFEAPCRLEEGEEYGNNVFLAMSDNGTSWTMYPNNTNPVPIIKSPVIKKGVYGVGQPSVYYKDGQFYIAYADAATGKNLTRLAVTEKNKPWAVIDANDITKHKVVINRAGASVRYNSVTNKYYCAWDYNNGGNANLFVMESADPYNWPYTDIAVAAKKLKPINTTDVYHRFSVDFAANAQGIIDTPTMYMIYTHGKMPPAGEDHRQYHPTWDIYIAAMNPKEKMSQPIILPNSKTSGSEALKTYQTVVAEWKRPEISAVKGTPKVDGTKDTAYNSSTVAKIVTVSPNYFDYAGDPTDTWGQAQFLWDENFLYIYAEIKDKTPNSSVSMDKPENIWKNDGLDIFIDVPNTMTGGSSVTLTPMSYMACLSANGKWIIKDNRDSIISSQFDKPVTLISKKVTDGYIIEAAVPWYGLVKNQIKSGKDIALDICINDNQKGSNRNSTILWSDYKSVAYKFLDRFGLCKLK